MSAATCAVRMCKGSHFFVSVKERRGKVWNEAGGGCEVAREYGEGKEEVGREYEFLTYILNLERRGDAARRRARKGRGGMRACVRTETDGRGGMAGECVIMRWLGSGNYVCLAIVFFF